jgi:hypothetical protein
MAKKENKYIVETKRDIDQSPVYVCVTGTDGEVISTKVPLGVEVLLDDNIVKSLKQRTEMVRVKATKSSNGERLVAKPTFSITKV